MQNFTDDAAKVIAAAAEAAKAHRQNYAGTEHLLAGLLGVTGGTASSVLREAGITDEKLGAMIERLIAPEGGAAVMDRPGFSPRAEAVISASGTVADELGAKETGTEHLLLAMLRDTECVGTRLLHTMGADIRKLYADTLVAINAQDRYSEQDIMSGRAMRPQSGSTPALDQYGRDMTKLAREGKLDPVVGRDGETLRLIQILSRRTKNNPCLVGEPGVGKTAIVEGLARRIASGEIPASMAEKRLIALDLTGMVAGSKYRGEFEERIRNVVKEASANRNILLFIDELHTLIGAGGAEGALDASNILKPSLSRGEIQVIGATTADEYRKYIGKDAALERRFQPVTVEEPSEEDSVRILEGLRHCYEEHHGVVITDEAIQAAVKMSERYINDRRLPDKAIDLVDEAASKLRVGLFKGAPLKHKEEYELERVAAGKEEAILRHDMDLARKLQKEQVRLEAAIRKKKERAEMDNAPKPEVTEELVAQVVAEWTRIPVAKLREEEGRRLARLEQELHKRVIGQDEAVTAVAAAIRRGRAGLKDPRRPIGSFLFLGPTGVGKTELSKAVAETVFGSERNMIRVDMSEYMEKYSVSKLIGSPPGYVGYDEGGQLSERVRRHPYSVVLFDEIEKAHPDVFNILLQVLDDGHITDAHGRKVDFKNTCIIMTSNAGAKSIVDPHRLGFSSADTGEKNYEAMKRGVMDEMKRIFRPEFLNRIDETIVFRPLQEQEVEAIAGLLLKSLKERAAEQTGMELKISPAVRKFAARKGFSAKYGARPIRRFIQNGIENPLAEKIVCGECGAGDSVSIGVRNEALVITVTKHGGEMADRKEKPSKRSRAAVKEQGEQGDLQ